MPSVLTSGWAPVSVRARGRRGLSRRGAYSRTSAWRRTNTNDRETFVCEDSLLAAVAPRPVGPAVADLLGAGDEFWPLGGGVVDAVGDDDSTHRVFCGW